MFNAIKFRFLSEKKLTQTVLSFMFLVVTILGICNTTIAQADGIPNNITIHNNNDWSYLPPLGNIPGFCHVEGNQVSDINPLSNTKTVGGDLYIFNTSLTDLDDLSKLEEVGGTLFIKLNRNLTSIDGLSNLKKVGGSLVVQTNQDLEECCVLQSLIRLTANKVEGSIIINNNNSDGNCTPTKIRQCPVQMTGPLQSGGPLTPRVLKTIGN